jgi:hypothetical protein
MTAFAVTLAVLTVWTMLGLVTWLVIRQLLARERDWASCVCDMHDTAECRRLGACCAVCPTENGEPK